MAAFDTPLSVLSEPMDMTDAGSPKGAANELTPTTIASFAPVKTSSYSSPRNTVVIHQKSPLLVATPPQVTRALAYSHPFLLPLNRLLGLISWSTGDPWESFLFLCSFWATVLYGDVLIVWAGPVVLVAGLMVAMYSRRFSPLSTYTSLASTKDHRRSASTAAAKANGAGSSSGSTSNSSSSSDKSSSTVKALIGHQKSLDDIVDTLNELTLRFNTLLEPFLKLTDFLSTQYSATSASTRPSLVRLLTRMLAVLPVWIVLSLPAVHLVTGRRVFFVIGTLVFTWHSKPARVCRTLLWRSLTVRRACNVITGLEFAGTAPADFDRSAPTAPGAPTRRKSQRDAANHLASSTAAAHRGQAGVRFNFSLFENQRRWIGVGWTTTLLAYERAAWTDEHSNACPSKDDFQLPKVEGGAGAAWRWVAGSEWHVEPVEKEGERKRFAPSSVSIRGRGGDDEGWIYYDNNWAGGRGQDGWGRYTRRRKWVREAELVEVGDEEEGRGGGATAVAKSGAAAAATELPADDLEASRATTATGSDSASVRKRKGFFNRRFSNKSVGKKGGSGGGSGGSSGGGSNGVPPVPAMGAGGAKSDGSRSASINEDEEDKAARTLEEEGEDERSLSREGWDVGDDMKMALG